MKKLEESDGADDDVAHDNLYMLHVKRIAFHDT
jgi:hypothetical protein